MEEEIVSRQTENGIETAVRMGAAMSPIRAHHEGGQSFVVVPKDFEVRSLENLSDKPARKRANVVVNDMESFCQYVKKHLRENCSTAYAKVDVESCCFDVVAVLDDHGAGDSGQNWQEHRCTLHSKMSFEWNKWLQHDREKFTQAGFAEFLEDNVQDITGDNGMPSGTEVLKMALNFERTADKRFRSKTNLQNGCVQLEFVDEENDKTRERMQMFSRFTIAIPIFQELLSDYRIAYPIEARLKYREKDGNLTFWYELVRRDRIFKLAVADEIKKLPQGLMVVYGSLS